MSLLKAPLLAIAIFQVTTSLAFASPYLERELEKVDEIGDVNTQVINKDGYGWGPVITGVFRNSLGNPIPRVSVVYEGKEYLSNDSGGFVIRTNDKSSNIIIKKAGYRKLVIAPQSGPVNLQLEPVKVKSFYMPSGILKAGKKSETYNNALHLIETTEINALTIDVKDDNGGVSQNLKPHIDILKAKNIYTIARIVAFKDNQAPRKNPSLALLNKNTGKPWEDKNHQTYLSPVNELAWDYLIGVAKDAAAIGFDEIQFDYVRFPTDGDRSTIQYTADGSASTSQSRSASIAGFLKKAHHELGAMGVFLAADVFGDTAFVPGDSGIGQNIEAIAPFLDYICPMVYPSGYNKGYHGVADPVNEPKKIVSISVSRYRLRAEAVNEDVVIRPWLQAFRDYSPAKKPYGAEEIRAQIDGSDGAGGDGFLLWNAAGKYSNLGLKLRRLIGLN